MAPPGYAPIAPPGYEPIAMAPPGYAPITVPSAVPRTVALWATILTGAYALLTLISATLTAGTIEELKTTFDNPNNSDPFAGQNPASLLITPVSIASFILLALWMSKIRAARKARGETIGGPPAVEWWGWFVPFANVVLPLLGMRAITKGRAGMGLLAGWWTTYIVAGALSLVPTFAIFGAIDFETGKLARPEVLDSMTGFAWAAGISLVISWVFLAMIIRVTTQREAEVS